MAAEEAHVTHFGAFRLDRRRGQLFCRDTEVRLRPKAWEVLRYLVDRHGEIVSVDELLDNVWKDLHVSIQSVTNVIYRLRAVFADGGGAAEWIQTVARRGYRFAAPIDTEPATNVVVAAAPEDGAAELLQPAAGGLFVGREPELAALMQRWQLALRHQPQVAFVCGEPGIGKTTLVRRFGAALKQPAQLGIGRCIPQESEAEPYMPVLEALGSLAMMHEVRDVAREQAPTWLLQMPWLLSRAERLALRQSRTAVGPARMLREGKRLFALLAEQGPLLLVLEDVHWADSATVGLIRALGESDLHTRVMLIATYRPSEIIARHHPLRDAVAELVPRDSTSHQLVLGSLAPAAVRQYLDLRFGSPPWAADLAAPLEDRSAGNPLFLEAMTTDLCQQGRIARGDDGHWRLTMAIDGIDVGLPETLREMIRTQLRRLDGDQLQLLEAASAAGGDFNTLEVAAALEIAPAQAEDDCARLAHHGHFIRPTGEVVWPDGAAAASYRFVHAAYRQALRDDASPSRWRQLHARIGQRLEAGFAHQRREIAPRLAKHFEAAGDLERQVEYLKLSVQLSAGRYAHRETVAYIDRLLHVIGRLPETPERATLEVGWQVERSNLFMDWQGYGAGWESFTRVLELARQQDNSFLQYVGHAGRCLSGFMGGAHREQARVEAAAMLDIAAQGHPELAALAHTASGCLCDTFGDPAAGLAHGERALAELPRALLGLPRGYDLETLVRVLLVTCLTRLGQLDRARQERALVIEGAETRAGVLGQAHAFAFMAFDTLISAEPALALQYSERAIERAREGGFEYFALAGHGAREAAKCALAADDAIDAHGLQRLAEIIEQRRRIKENWYNMLLGGYLADAYRRRGELASARETIDAAISGAEAAYLAELWRIKAAIEIAAAPPRHGATRHAASDAAAMQCLQMSIDLARRQHTKLFELRAAVAVACLRRGNGTDRHALAQLRGTFSAGCDGPDLQAADAVLRR